MESTNFQSIPSLNMCGHLHITICMYVHKIACYFNDFCFWHQRNLCNNWCSCTNFLTLYICITTKCMCKRTSKKLYTLPVMYIVAVKSAKNIICVYTWLLWELEESKRSLYICMDVCMCILASPMYWESSYNGDFCLLYIQIYFNFCKY